MLLRTSELQTCYAAHRPEYNVAATGKNAKEAARHNRQGLN
jgi:hypothetical protein